MTRAMENRGLDRIAMRTRVLIAGVSTRAAAESAARAGFEVTAIDAFADRDQHPAVHALSLSHRFTSPAAAKAAQDVECDAVAYVSSFENHPRAVRLLGAGRALWGNPPVVLERVRDPIAVAHTFRQLGFEAPGASFDSAQDGPEAVEGPDAASDRWLVKPLASGGGHRIRPWSTTSVPRGCYRQERVEGTPGSVVFVAARGRAVPLGVSRQLIGEEAFGAAGYRYCGNILGASGDPQFACDTALADAACALARAAAEAFGLVGVNGIDFVARDGIPHVIEINPRWCASMELVERAYTLSVFGAHAVACADGMLPALDLLEVRRAARGAVGKAVVFARHSVTVEDTDAWLRKSRAGAGASIRDIPHRGGRIAAGRPICTVFAAARDACACHAALVRRAERVYAEVAAWDRHERH